MAEDKQLEDERASLKRKLERSPSPQRQSTMESKAQQLPTTVMTKYSSYICNRIHSILCKSSHPYPPVLDLLADEIIDQFRRENGEIFVYGVGREGLMMKSLWWHLREHAFNAHFVSDYAGPNVYEGDLLIASAGPGGYPTVDAVCCAAKSKGARVLLLTTEPKTGSCVKHATLIGYIPVKFVDDDMVEASRRLLPSASEFELALLALFDMVIYLVGVYTEDPPEWIRSRQADLI